MKNKEQGKILEEFEKKSEHEIPPCDLESGNYVQVKLKREDASKLKELLIEIIDQLK